MANQIKLQNNFKASLKGLEKDIEKAMLKGAIRVHREVTQVLTGNRSGFTYNVPGTGRVVNKEKTLANGRVFHYRKLEGAKTYKASAPFEPPASRLGNLRASYQYKVKGQGFNSKGYVGSPLDYAPMLEKGTVNMHPRPHLSLAFQNARKDIEKYFAQVGDK